MAKAHRIIPQLSEKDITRFWSKVDKSGSTFVDLGPCWMWKGSLFSNGYGQFHIHGIPFGAHRIAFILNKGFFDDPAHLIAHHCDIRACCNPQHLFEGTDADNVIDMVQKDRHQTRKGHNHYSHIKPELLAHGERNASAKLTEKEIHEIRLAYSKGTLNNTALARIYSVTVTNISYVVHRKTWTHI